MLRGDLYFSPSDTINFGNVLTGKVYINNNFPTILVIISTEFYYRWLNGVFCTKSC